MPLLREGAAIGVFALTRDEVNPFTDKQIELVATFADQAVIAIENARLLSELRESLEQQTATSEVLSVISSSPGELEPVFQAMLENATRICEAELSLLWRAEGDGFRPVALCGVPPELAGMRQPDQIFHFDPETPLGRLAQTKQLIHVADVRTEPAYVKGLQPLKEFVDVFGARTTLLVPMLKDNVLVGIIGIWRTEVRPLLTNKSRWCRTSPSKPSSPLRMRGCSTNCVNRWSSRQRPLKSCESSVRRRANCSQCFKPF